MKKSRYSFMFLLILALVFLSQQASFADFGDIQIDGYYDDWEDKPHTQLYKGNNPKPKVINLVSLFRDEFNVNVHIIFSEQYSLGIKNMDVEIETNLGNGYYELRESENYSLLEYGLEAEEEPVEEEAADMPIMVPMQTGNEIRAFDVYRGSDIVGEGYMTVVDWKTVEAEFYIPLSTISSQPDGITEISMGIKKLGPQVIHCVGAGTNPYLGITISLGVAVAVAAMIMRIKKRRTKEAKD